MAEVKTSDEIFQDIHDRFVDKTGDNPGAVIDLYALASAEVTHGNYQAIDDNRTPHVWTYLEGTRLDDTGTWVNVPRKPGESDDSYKYRLMQWKQMMETSNRGAIDTACLSPQYAENISFVPFTHGCGTATCYVIPKHYTQESISESLLEARKIIEKYASAQLYVDYIIPEVRSVSLEIYLKTSQDETAIKQYLTDSISTYINSIAPNDYLSLGDINRMGVNTSSVEYFSVLGLYINNHQVSTVRVLQDTESKMLFDEIHWIGDTSNADV